MIARFLFLFCSVTRHTKRMKKVLELRTLKDFISMVVAEGTFQRSPFYVNQNLLGTVNTGWVFLVIIANQYMEQGTHHQNKLSAYPEMKRQNM